VLAETDPFDGKWRFSLTPYLWLPNVNGHLEYDLPPGVAEFRQSDVRSLGTEIGPNDYLENLQFALMLSGEARKGAWSVVTDIIYLDLGKQDSSIDNVRGVLGESLPDLSHQADTRVSATVWTLGGGYTLSRGAWGNADLILGFRYLGLDTELTWQLASRDGRLERTGKVSSNKEQWDGILGVRGQILFGETRWFMPYYMDLGTGSSNWTWQAVLGAGYRFDWGDVTLALRSLSYEFDEDDADIRFTGPVLGATFHW
jgi:hypothetical protein